MTYKRFVDYTLCISICILGIIALFNYIMDPTGMFKKEKCWSRFADAMVRGDILVIDRNVDEGALKIFAVERITSKDIIVLGSSQIMGLGSAIVSDNLSLYNLAVSSAALGDDIALWELYSENHNRPKYLIIGLDSITLSHHSRGRWQEALGEYFDRGMNRISGNDAKINFSERNKQSIFELYIQTLSIQLTKESIRLFNEGEWRGENKLFFEPVNNIESIPDNVRLLFPDGSYEWSKKDYSQNSDERAMEYMQNLKGRKFVDLDEITMHIFVSYIEKVKGEGTKVIFYLTPLHPIVYKNMISSGEWDGVMKSEVWIRNIAQIYSIDLYGSFNPKNMGLSSKDFIDHGHLKRSSLEKYFKENVRIN